jgi:hypothetical protein
MALETICRGSETRMVGLIAAFVEGVLALAFAVVLVRELWRN